MSEMTYKGKKSSFVKTMREVSRAFGVAYGTVIRWNKKGMPVEPDGTYDLLKIGKWSGRITQRKDETYEAEVLALTANTTMTAKQIADRLNIKKERVDWIRRIHVKDKQLGEFVTEKKADGRFR